jgi:hypothetical protein
MPTITISYRQEDSAPIARLIFEWLRAIYDHVFMDFDIPFGVPFADHIQEVLSRTDVLIVVIGRQWMGGGKKKRIHDEDDLVRIEVKTALERGIPVIPVLVNKAKMPRKCDLPDCLKELASINAAVVSPLRDFHDHMRGLICAIDKRLTARAVPAVGSAPSAQAPKSAPADLYAIGSNCDERESGGLRESAMAMETQEGTGDDYLRALEAVERALLPNEPCPLVPSSETQNVDRADSADSPRPTPPPSGSSRPGGMERNAFAPRPSAVMQKLLTLILGVFVPLLSLLSTDTLAPTALRQREATLSSPFRVVPPQPTPAPVLQEVQPEGQGGSAPLPQTAAIKPAPAPKLQVRTGSIIQVGAYPSEQEAKERLVLVQTMAPKMLKGADPFIEITDKDGTPWYRARFAVLDDERAENACKYLKRNEVDCWKLVIRALRASVS